MKTGSDRLQMAIAALPPGGAPFAVLRIGMDNFRAVNGALGVTAGDEVLAQAEQRLRAGLGEHEIAIRLPGDEFAVLLYGVSSVIRAGAEADRLNTLLHRAYKVQGKIASISACLGVALAPEDGVDAEILLKRAGIALQHAKSAGSGVVQLFEPAMEKPRRKQSAFFLNLHNAHMLQQF